MYVRLVTGKDIKLYLMDLQNLEAQQTEHYTKQRLDNITVYALYINIHYTKPKDNGHP